MSPPTVLVLGANGRFGAAAVQAFAAAGWHVLAQVRREPSVPLPAGVEAVVLPLDEPAALIQRAAGARVVVYAVNPPYTDWPRQMLPLARQGMSVAQGLGATFMLPGNVYNFGEGMPPVLDEGTPERPSTVKGRLRAELEAELAARAGQGLRSVVIRAGDFFGGGTGSWLDLAIARKLRQGKLVYPGPLDRPHAWAYLPDLARAFVAVAESAARDERPAATRLHFAGHTLTGQEMLDAVERAAQALGERPAAGFRRGTMPWATMRVMGWFMPLLREVVEMAYLWRVPHALDGQALQARVGALPATPIDAALQSALHDLGFGGPAAKTAPIPGIVTADSTRRHPA
jgi:nucleoside-diphosphate-sugar epimerase